MLWTKVKKEHIDIKYINKEIKVESSNEDMKKYIHDAIIYWLWCFFAKPLIFRHTKGDDISVSQIKEFLENNIWKINSDNIFLHTFHNNIDTFIDTLLGNGLYTCMPVFSLAQSQHWKGLIYSAFSMAWIVEVLQVIYKEWQDKHYIANTKKYKDILKARKHLTLVSWEDSLYKQSLEFNKYGLEKYLDCAWIKKPQDLYEEELVDKERIMTKFFSTLLLSTNWAFNQQYPNNEYIFSKKDIEEVYKLKKNMYLPFFLLKEFDKTNPLFYPLFCEQEELENEYRDYLPTQIALFDNKRKNKMQINCIYGVWFSKDKSNPLFNNHKLSVGTFGYILPTPSEYLR